MTLAPGKCDDAACTVDSTGFTVSLNKASRRVSRLCASGVVRWRV